MLQLFKKHHNYQHYLGKSVKLKDWGETFKINDFDECRVAACAWNTKDGSPHDAAWVTTANTSAVNAGVHSITSASPKPNDEVTAFRKGTRRDATLHEELKDQRNWHQWWSETKSTTQAQDVADVLDPNYQPNNQNQMLLFAEKQKHNSFDGKPLSLTKASNS